MEEGEEGIESIGGEALKLEVLMLLYAHTAFVGTSCRFVHALPKTP